MAKIDDEPAFPRNYSAMGHNGMTLRDWFAGQALAAIAGTIAAASQQSIDQACKDDGFAGTRGDYTARIAYAFADAMIAERSK